MSSRLKPAAALAAMAVLSAGAANAQTSYTYTYDALGRLTGRTSPSGNSSTYTYDAAGNRTQATFANSLTLAPGQSLHSSDGKYQLLMQSTDGNLVVYGPNGANWAANTGGNPGAYAVFLPSGVLTVYSPNGGVLWQSNNFVGAGGTLVMQTDGNLVIYDASGKPRWASLSASLTSPDRMLPGQNMLAGAQLVSADGRFRLMYQDNGYLVINFNGQVLWQSPTAVTSPTQVSMQSSDGNLVAYGANSAVSITNLSTAHPGAYVVMQTDGNLVLYAPQSAGGGALWATNTGGH